MQTYLFIGGNHDGLNISAEGKPEYMQLTGREIYIRETLTLGVVSVTVYVHETLTLAQALDRLFDYYKPWIESRNGGRL